VVRPEELHGGGAATELATRLQARTVSPTDSLDAIRQRVGVKRTPSSENSGVTALSYTCGAVGMDLRTEEIGGFESLIAHHGRPSGNRT